MYAGWINSTRWKSNLHVPKQDLKSHEEIPEIIMMVYFPAPVLTEMNPTKQLQNALFS